MKLMKYVALRITIFTNFFLSKFAEMRLLITLYNFPKAASIFDKDVCLKCLSKCTYTTN